MPNIVAIAKDHKTQTELERLCGELNLDDLRFAMFNSTKEFEDLYFKSSNSSSTTSEDSGPEDLRLFSFINILLVAEDGLAEAPQVYIPKILKNLGIKGLWPKENRTRVIYLKFEDDHFDKTQIVTPEIEDLIYLPLDRLLFLQKMEIFLSMPKMTKPSFLFNQQLDAPIEISKIVMLDRLTDCALAIRNRTPLKSGVRGKFYLAPPGEKNRIRFFGKVFRNEPHPDHPGEYLVYFFFFGVRKNEISTIRKWLGSNPKYHSLLVDDPKKFAFNPLDMFLTEDEKKTYSVAIVDYDDEHSAHISEFLERKIDRISISTHSSFSMFYENALSKKGGQSDFSPSATSVDDLPKGGFRFSFNMDSKTISSCVPELSDKQLFCGHPLDQVFKIGDKSWWSYFDLKQNDLVVQESLSFLKDGKPYKRMIFAKDSQSNWRGFFAEFTASENELTISLSPASSEAIVEKAPRVSVLKSLDVLIIDTVFVPQENFDSWLDGLLDKVYSEGLVRSKEDLKIILISEKENRLDEHWLKRDNVVSFVLKPADSKTIAVTVAVVLENKNTVYNFDNLGWISPHLKTHLSKPVHLHQISEFGATVDTSTPFKEGSFFYLRKSIFDEAPNGCLAARVYFTEPHPSEPGRFLCHATYFGINDAFLKHARTYMREAYAHSKNKS